MELLYKSVDVTQFKFDDESHGGYGGFTGYASVFNVVDSYGDIVRAGAYADCLKDFVRDGWLAVGHEWGTLGVGFIADAREDHYGLMVDAAFHSTKEAQDARTVVRERKAAGKSVSLSIGYRVPNGGRVELDDGTYDLLKVDLKEISVVPCPANALATITSAKSGSRAGLPFADHSDAVRVAVEEFVVRARAIAGLRAKEGRVLSAMTRARIAECRDAIEEATSSLLDVDADLADLLAATEPAPKSEPVIVTPDEPDPLAATRQVYAEYLRSLSA